MGNWKLMHSYVYLIFTDLLLISLEHLPWFSPGYEGTESMSYFLTSAITTFSCLLSVDISSFQMTSSFIFLAAQCSTLNLTCIFH